MLPDLAGLDLAHRQPSSLSVPRRRACWWSSLLLESRRRRSLWLTSHCGRQSRLASDPHRLRQNDIRVVANSSGSPPGHRCLWQNAALILQKLLRACVFHAEASALGAAAWLTHYTGTLAASFEAEGLRKPAQAWSGWHRCAQAHARVCSVPDPASPTSLALAAFLHDVSQGGPVAADSAKQRLRLLRTHSGFSGLLLDSTPPEHNRCSAPHSST